MHDPVGVLALDLVAELAEHPQHGRVGRQHLGDEPGDPGVPRGRLSRHRAIDRPVWVYEPAGAAAGPRPVVVLLDGEQWVQRMDAPAIFDNLVKGAAGSAVQNLNVLLGLDERTGLL